MSKVWQWDRYRVPRNVFLVEAECQRNIVFDPQGHPNLEKEEMKPNNIDQPTD